MTERDWAGVSYVRVYQSIRDDPKLAAVYADDRLLAAWLRLLMDADLAYPGRASVPAHLSRYARAGLVKLGVLEITGRTFSLSGLVKERTERAMTGAQRQALWRDRHRNGPVTEGVVTSITEGSVTPVTPRTRAGASASVSDVTSSLEGGAGGNQTAGLQDAIGYIEDRTRRPWGFGAGSKPWETLTADVAAFGWPKVRAAMEALKEPFPDVGQLVFGASRRLHPIAKVTAEDDSDDRFNRGVERTQRELRRLRGESA